MSSVEIAEPAWNADGLIAAIIVDAHTSVVRMLGWMNREALSRTRDSGDVWFWSRSRQVMWRKGESSGNTLKAVEIRIDCDRDAVLVSVLAKGPTCHTGTTSCFNERVTNLDSKPDSNSDSNSDDGPAGHAIDVLFKTLESRRGSDATESYTASLLAKGVDKINRKIAEESGELTAALASESDERVVSEAADVIYHLLVGLVGRDIPASSVWHELSRRAGVSGHVEKASRDR